MTAQTPDFLLHRGYRHQLCTLPLCIYLQRIPQARRPKFCFTSSALWRGYVATWEIRDSALWLVDIDGLVETDHGLEEARLENLFPWRSPPIKATWMTGELRCPEGRRMVTDNRGFASIYERDRLIDIRRGEVTDEFLRINPPGEVIYAINPDGSRIFRSNVNGFPETFTDPYGPGETPVGERFWQTEMDYLTNCKMDWTIYPVAEPPRS